MSEPICHDDRQPIISDEESIPSHTPIPAPIPKHTASSPFAICRRFLHFVGPGFLMSIAYLDPGNIESDLRVGAVARYSLLWLLLLSTLAGLFMQRLAARVGVVSGQHLAELCRRYYHPLAAHLLWLMIELAIIGSDMQEVIGTAIALNLLTNQALPLWAGVLVTIGDTFTFLLLEQYGTRQLEALFALLIAVMSASFGYEYWVAGVPQTEVLRGLVVPGCGPAGCSATIVFQAVAMIGAVIMPHNIYLHSALVRSRNVDTASERDVSEANAYFFAESTLALMVSFVINLFVVCVFGRGLYGTTSRQVHQLCVAANSSYADMFPASEAPVQADILRGGVFLGCKYGPLCMYVWAVGVLAAGQSSTMSGTYAGQFVMQGFLRLRFARWARVLLTRSVAIVPTVLVAVLYSRPDHHLTNLNDLLNALMALQLPFALLPVLTFTSSAPIMRRFRNGAGTLCVAVLVSALVVAINLYFMAVYLLRTHLVHTWPGVALVCAVTLFYVLSIVYLACVMLRVVCGGSGRGYFALVDRDCATLPGE